MTLPAVRAQLAGMSPFLVRLIDRDLGFVQRAPRGLIRGAVLSTRTLALANGSDLARALRTLRIPYLMDPDTAVLVEVRPGHERAAWLATMPAAASITSLPIGSADLETDQQIELFARAVASTQRHALAMSAGYFAIGHQHDPFRSVNRRLVSAALRMAAGRPVCAWLELPLTALRNDDLARVVASDYREVDLVVLRVAGLRPGSASEPDASAVLDAVKALNAVGPRVVVDSIGRLGAAALPAGAQSYTGGVRHHESVPLVRVHRRPPSSSPLGYSVVLQFRQISRADALEMASTGELDPCDDKTCDALDPALAKTRRPASLRRHALHAISLEAGFAAQASAAELAHQLLASPAPGAQAWGRALQRFDDAAQVRTHSPR